MLLEDYARLYTFRAASLTMARMVSPRLSWRVRNAMNDNLRRAAASGGMAQKGCGVIPAPQPTISQTVSHAALHTGETA